MRTDPSSTVHLSLIVPAYNEAARIAASLAAIEDYLRARGDAYEVIVVNDGSVDNTLATVRDYASGSDTVRVISYEHNCGKGYAVRQGVFAARGDYIGFSDVDLSAPIEEIYKLFEALSKGYDVAIGSRALRESVLTVHQPFYREIGGKVLNLIIQSLAVPGVWDTQCGFKLMRGQVAHDIFERCILDGWGFDVEVLYLARKLGYTIAEVPVRWGHAGNSKLHPFRDALRMIRDIIRIRTHNYRI